MSHTEFARAFGAEVDQIDKMRQFARENKLNFLEQGDETLRRTVNLSGTVVALERAFSVELMEFEHDNGSYRGHAGPILMPEECAPFVSGVFGLDNRQIAEPYFRLQGNNAAFDDQTTYTTYTPTQVARLYDFPNDPNGNGQRIALIELGGGYRPADIANYFRSLELQAPTVRSLPVDQANNCPGMAQSADCQVMLDIEMAGAIAPGVSIAVYFAPNTARGLQNALSKAVHDQLNKPSAICIGWGAAECNWSGQSVQNFEQVAHEAAMIGITITAAAGDNGSSCGKMDGKAHVSFPASCPYVLAVGGTRLTSADGMIVSESVWNNGGAADGTPGSGSYLGGVTGGGFSRFFSRLPYQLNHVSNLGRGVPDVVANADPDTGYNILVDGLHQVVGGTSAATALMTGLVIVLNQKLNRKLGFVNPALYSLCRSNAFREIASGTNGAYSASRGWNPVTGMGSPVGTQLLRHLEVSTSAEEQVANAVPIKFEALP
jgi:kumamolisin